LISAVVGVFTNNVPQPHFGCWSQDQQRQITPLKAKKFNDFFIRIEVTFITCKIIATA